MPLVDTHCHIDVDRFDRDRDDVIRRAWEAGLEWLVVVGSGDGLPGARRALALARSVEQAFATIGVHPHEAKDWSLAANRALHRRTQRFSPGEIGLDHITCTALSARSREFRARREIGAVSCTRARRRS
jgi:TatD DNase family protein